MGRTKKLIDNYNKAVSFALILGQGVVLSMITCTVSGQSRL